MERWINGNLSMEEIIEMNNWVSKDKKNQFLVRRFHELKGITERFKDLRSVSFIQNFATGIIELREPFFKISEIQIQDEEANNRDIHDSMAQINNKNARLALIKNKATGMIELKFLIG